MDPKYTVYEDEVSEVDSLQDAIETVQFAGHGHVEDENGNVVYEFGGDVPDWIQNIVDEDGTHSI